MVEKKAQKIKTQSDYLSDNKSSEDEVNPHLCTSQEERVYGTIKGSMQVTQAALSHTTMQCNPTVERGLLKQPKIKKRISHCDITLFSDILFFLYQYIFVTIFHQVYVQLK